MIGKYDVHLNNFKDKIIQELQETAAKKKGDSLEAYENDQEYFDSSRSGLKQYYITFDITTKCPVITSDAFKWYTDYSIGLIYARTITPHDILLFSKWKVVSQQTQVPMYFTETPFANLTRPNVKEFLNAFFPDSGIEEIKLLYNTALDWYIMGYR